MRECRRAAGTGRREAPGSSQSRRSSASKPRENQRRKDRDRGTKPGNDRWSEGRQEGGKAEAMNREEPSAEVPARDKQAEEDLWQRHKAERGVWTEPMLEALARGLKGNKWFSLIDKVWSERTLGLAWEKVKSNAGACGVDGITVERFDKDSQKRLLAVKEHLKEGSYQPKPVKRVWIPKPGSAEKRPLGIPTVADRVVQAALRMVIEPVFEDRFAPHSYGFRPGRGCKDALRRVDGLLDTGRMHVVEVDIKDCFGSIGHDRLLAKVREHIADGRVLGLIGAFLAQGVMEGTDWTAAKGQGTPQGGVVSPLLANVYLDGLDWLMAGRGFEMARYADDMVVVCASREEALVALETLREWMAGAGLTLHPDKTRVVDMNLAGSHFDFLGYRFLRSRRGKLVKLVRPKSLRKLRESIKPRTRRTSGRSMDAMVADLNRTLRGWYGYFKHALAGQLGEIDGWVRGRLRSILRKRHGRKGRGRGRDHQRWPNRYFSALGLFCLLEARHAELTSLRDGANH
jgi:RNA-directed DNA polymerase